MRVSVTLANFPPGQVAEDEVSDNSAECVVCLSDVRDTLILPCRHLCLCNSCADTLRYQANNCPICRLRKPPEAPPGPPGHPPLRRGGSHGGSSPSWLPQVLMTCFLLRSLPGTAPNPSYEEKTGPSVPNQLQPYPLIPDLRLRRAFRKLGIFSFFTFCPTSRGLAASNWILALWRIE